MLGQEVARLNSFDPVQADAAYADTHAQLKRLHTAESLHTVSPEEMSSETVGRRAAHYVATAMSSVQRELPPAGQGASLHAIREVVNDAVAASEARMVRTLGEAVAASEARMVRTLGEAVAASEARMVRTLGEAETRLTREIRRTDARAIARAYNGRQQTGARKIRGIPDNDGQVPRQFPETISDFWAMRRATAQRLLAAYGLDAPPDAALGDLRLTLAEFANVRKP